MIHLFTLGTHFTPHSLSLFLTSMLAFGLVSVQLGFVVTLVIVAINSWNQQIFPSRTPDHMHAATFEARVQTAILPWAHVKIPHPSLEALTPGEPGAKTLLNVV